MDVSSVKGKGEMKERMRGAKERKVCLFYSGLPMAPCRDAVSAEIICAVKVILSVDTPP